MAFKKLQLSKKLKDTRDKLVSWRDAWSEEEYLGTVHAAVGTGITVEALLDQTLTGHSGFFFGVRYETKAELGAAILQRGNSSLLRWRAKHGYVDGHGVEHPPTVAGQR
jgi:hypothetical protein